LRRLKIVDISFVVSDDPDIRAQQQKGLEFGIPVLYDSLIAWMDKKKPNLTRGSINNLDVVFRKAEELGIMGLDSIKSIYDEYIKVRPEALAIARLPANY